MTIAIALFAGFVSVPISFFTGVASDPPNKPTAKHVQPIEKP
jgi:hypothetical protein